MRCNSRLIGRSRQRESAPIEPTELRIWWRLRELRSGKRLGRFASRVRCGSSSITCWPRANWRQFRQERQTRTEALKLYDERLAAGEISQPEVDVVRTSLTLLDVTMQRALGLLHETRVALETALGLAPMPLDGVHLRWWILSRSGCPAADSPSGQRACNGPGLLNRLDKYWGGSSRNTVQAENASPIGSCTLISGHSRLAKP